jgi:exopolyphosphatase/guanosine-5'-triphosphate,3'-diphosphate pyrophosphatase
MPSVAVIDIGSNSIKLLVAARAPDGQLTTLAFRVLEVRISAGISRAKPRLSDEGCERGFNAIQALLAEAAVFTPQSTVLVATSAVRDAENGPDFRERVRAATGHVIRILTGEEEANLIGRGLTCDPTLRHLQDFYVFDLGGGSLECLAFRDRKTTQAVSLQLGCVRLTEQFVADASQPLSEAERAAISAHTRETLQQSGFTFSLPAAASAIGTGGTLTSVRAILAARHQQTFNASSAHVTLEDLRELLSGIGRLPLSERKKVEGLPPSRADIFPAALATMIAVAETGGLTGFENSTYNLRWGLAAEALEKS